MRRMRSRWLSLVATAALTFSLMPAGPASGAVVRESGKVVRPANAPTVHVAASPRGVRVMVSGLDKDSTAIDVYRSTAAGEEGVKLNNKPVPGAAYYDTTAQPGQDYYYTVKVVKSRPDTGVGAAAAGAPMATLPQVKGAVKAKPSAVKSAAVKSKPADKPAASAVAAVHKPADQAKVAAISASAIVKGTPDTTTAVSGTWSGEVFVRGDVVVPAGQTLTVAPGTKVYFDTVASELSGTHGSGSDPDPTTGCDLIVHGKIVAQGSATAPIVFTSVNSIPASGSVALPEPGDWGTIFVDSRAASVISNARIEYANGGVWAYHTNRPYVSSCTFVESNNGWNSTSGPWATVYFENPIADAVTPRIMVTNSSVDSNDEGILVLWQTRADTKGNLTIDPVISGNKVQASYPLDLEIYEEDAPASYGDWTIKGTISGNTLISDGSNPLYLDCESEDTGDAAILTALSNNTMVANNDSAVYMDCESNGVGTSANLSPTFSGDKLSSSSSYAVEAYAYANAGSTTSTAPAYGTPKFTNCQLRSNADYALYLYAENSSAGVAYANPVFSGGSFESGWGYGVYAYSDSSNGSASSSPSFTNVTGRVANGSEAVYCESYAYAAGKLAKSSPRWVGGSLTSGDDDGMYLTASSDAGSAEVKPYVSGTTIRAYGYPIYAEAYAGNASTGTANVSGTLLSSNLISSEYAGYYGYAYNYNKGGSVASPYVSKCAFTAEDSDGLDLEAYAYEGNVVVSPTVLSSTFWGYGNAVDGYAQRYAGGPGTYTATVSPNISGTTAFSKYDYALQLEAYNGGKGDALIKPTVSASDIISGYYEYGLYAYADVNDAGTADVSPVMSKTNIKADYEALYLSANSGGAGQYARVNGAYTDCTFTSSWSDAANLWAYGYGNGAENKPVFTRCRFEALESYGYSGGAAGYGPAGATFTASPVFSGGSVPFSGDGIYIDAQNYGDQGPGPDAANYVTAARITNMPIYSTWNYGIQTSARTYGTGNATNKSVISASPVKAYDSIRMQARCESNPWQLGTSGTGTALDQNTLSGTSTAKMNVEVYDDCGVNASAYSAHGQASELSTLKYLTISAYNEAVYAHSYTGGDATTATAKPVIASNVTSNKWGGINDAVYVEGYAADGVNSVADVAPAISGNIVGGSFSDGIKVYGNASATKMSPVVSSNTINDSLSNGIEISASNATTSSAPQVLKNKADKTEQCGLYISGVPGGLVSQNKFTNPGWFYDGNTQYSTSCIYWSGANPATARVKGNMLNAARSAAVFYDNGAATTEYNSFGDASGNQNRPFTYWADDSATSTVSPYSARYNWWGTTNAATVASMVNVPNYSGAKSDIVTTTPILPSLNAKVTSIGVAKTATTVKFTVKFDRPMDTAIKTLTFGKSSPYKTYKVTGTWSADGKTFTGSRARAGLPTGVKMYFAGALDLPGNPMASTSKYFKL